MENNIYIGNRYVPILANPIEWDNLRTYEPLTIVTHNGTAYTSRQNVPVGIELSNKEYWVVTGNLNGIIMELEQKVDNINTSLDTKITDNDNYTKKYLGITKKRNILLIGDSYMSGLGATSTTIESVLRTALNANTYNYSYGGTGFVKNTNNHSFLNQIYDAINNASLDKSIITDVLIAGGYNDDLATTQDSYYEQAKSMVNLCNTHIPNAKVWFVPMMWTNNSYDLGWANKFLRMYNACKATGQNTFPTANTLLFRKPNNYISSDGVHPTSLGYEVIGNAIASWMNGTYCPQYEMEAFNVVLPGGEQANFFYELKDGTVFVKLYFFTDTQYGLDATIFASELPPIATPPATIAMIGTARATSNEPVNVTLGESGMVARSPLPKGAQITLTASFPFTPYIYQ